MGGGTFQVRLPNAHLVTVLLRPSVAGAAFWAPLAGERVLIELGPDELEGWRFARQPEALAA